jgi:hypothetical protein
MYVLFEVMFVQVEQLFVSLVYVNVVLQVCMCFPFAFAQRSVAKFKG